MKPLRTSPRPLSLLLIVAATMAAIWLLHAIRPPEDARAAQVQWHFLPPPPGAEQPVQLPHTWPQGTASGDYRGRFVLPFVPEPGESWMIYLTSLGGGVQLQINGTLLDTPQAGRRALPRTQAQPLQWLIPASLLRPGSNEIAIAMQAEPPGGFLGPAYVTPAQRFATYAWYRSLLKNILPLILIVTTIVFGSVSLVIWLARRQEPVYLWHALTCFSGAGYSAVAMTPLVRNAPLPPLWSDALAVTLFIWFVAAGAVMGVHQHRLRAPRLLHFAAAFGALGLAGPALVALAIRNGDLPYPALPACYVLGVVTGTFTGWKAFIEPHWRRPDAASFWLLCGALTMAAASMHDALILLRLISPWQGLWFAYAAPVALLAFSWLLLRRFLEALREAELLNRHLEERVAQREAEIARNYEALRRAEQAQAIAGERERLFGELHDGLGGTLVAALSRLSNQGSAESPVARSLQSALDDLRMTLTSLHPEENTLRAALAPLRERLDSACADAGIELCFELDGIPDTLPLPKPQLLHLLRILQEAASNALRHARCRQLRVAMRLVTGDGAARSLEICVADDGVGFDPDAPQRSGHYGLANLRRRAAQIGAEIVWRSQQPGTAVELRLPLDASGGSSTG